MKSGKNESRRSLLKKAGGALLAIPIAGSAAASEESADSKRNDEERGDESREVLYARENVRVIKYNDHEYAVKGDFTPRERRELMKEYVWSDDDDEVSTQTHDDSGSDVSSECITVNGNEWGIMGYTDAWSQASHSKLTFEGEASATSWSDCTWNYKQAVDEIYIRTTLKGEYRERIQSITAPPAYTVSWGSGIAKATLDGSRTNEYSYSLFHYEDTVVMEADDCWYWSAQDDAFRFSIENEDHWIGTYVEMDVGHCLI